MNDCKVLYVYDVEPEYPVLVFKYNEYYFLSGKDLMDRIFCTVEENNMLLVPDVGSFYTRYPDLRLVKQSDYLDYKEYIDYSMQTLEQNKNLVDEYIKEQSM